MKHFLLSMFLFAVGTGWGFGQQVHMSTPMHNLNSSFNESIGTNWGVSGKNGFFRFGGGGVPATANGGMQTGFPIKVGGMNGSFNGWAGQSYSASNSVYAPSVTSMNGYPAYIGAGNATPFVLGVTPVVGDWSNHSIYPYVPPMDYSSHHVLQERVRRLEEEKAFQRERPRQKVADVTPIPKKARRSTSTQTAERPAMSVQEMKRLRAMEQNRSSEENSL